MNEIGEGMDAAVAAEAIRRAAPLIDWLARSARGVEDVQKFYGEFCERVAGAGLPLERSSVHARTLHPEILGISLIWRAGRGAELTQRYRGVETTPTFTNSPVYWIYGGAERFRRQLEHPGVKLDFAVLHELKEEGFTDYVAQRLPFTDGSNHAITWATRRAGGFSEADIAFIDALVPHLGLIIEARSIRIAAERLLKVYLGADAGERVLRGQVTRGSGQIIDAAILFADLRGFTELSESMSAQQVIDLLNEYFESVISAVDDHRGEVLKLIGDGLLAIFPLRSGGGRPASLAALTATRAAFGSLTEVNRRRVEQGKLAFRVGITLHLGRVIYGNIGGADRLDFTVIGPAVNMVSRLQTICRRFGKGVVVSAEFAREAGVPLISMGQHELRGIAEPVEVFALTPREDPYWMPDSG